MTIFKDAARGQGLLDDIKVWMNGLTSKSKPDEDLFRPTPMVMARRWVQRQD